MDALLDHLDDVVLRTRAQVVAQLEGGQILAASDDQIVRALTVAAELQRLAEAVLVEASGEVARRSRQRERELRMTSRFGCHDISELLQRSTRLSAASASRLQRVAAPTAVREGLTGAPLPPVLPALRAALLDGTVGVDALLATAGPLEEMSRRVPYDDVLTADAAVAAEARGQGAAAAPAACAEVLRLHARAWAAYLDQDGAEPEESDALRRRGITLGRARDGVIPISGNLLPETAAQFARICHAVTSPHADQDGGVSFRPSDGADSPAPDDRTPAQKRHDALTTALTVAASSRLLPTIGGAAPTLVVAVREQDLAEGRGWAHIDGEPVSLGAATHAGCAGVIQRVLLARDGRIVRIGTEERVFNRHQRRAIALRDGGCIIPGCGVPAAWCEIHREHGCAPVLVRVV